MTETKVLKNVFVIGIQFALIMGLAVLLPLGFHIAGLKGDIFIPIYTATIFAAVSLNIPMAVIVGLISPVVNNMVTGMPSYYPFPMMQILLIELAVLAVSLSLFKKSKLPIFAGIVLAIVLARFSSILCVVLFDEVNIGWFINHIVVSYPGVLLNIVIGYIFSRFFYEKKR